MKGGREVLGAWRGQILSFGGVEPARELAPHLPPRSRAGLLDGGFPDFFSPSSLRPPPSAVGALPVCSGGLGGRTLRCSFRVVFLFMTRRTVAGLSSVLRYGSQRTFSFRTMLGVLRRIGASYPPGPLNDTCPSFLSNSRNCCHGAKR